MKAKAITSEPRIVSTPIKTDGILAYDSDNAYPQRMINHVAASGTATACVGLKSRFIVGGGFNDKDFYKQVVNRKGQTADKLLRKAAQNMARIPLIAIHINYNAQFKKVEAQHIPFQFVRFGIDDRDGMVAIYDDWSGEKGKRKKREDVTFIHLYNPRPEVIKQQVIEAGGFENYKGQVYLWTPFEKEYPLATFDPVLEDIISDAKAKTFKLRNLSTNFMASHLFITSKFATDEQRAAFDDEIMSFMGADDALNVMVLEKENETDTLEIKDIKIQDVEDLYDYTERSVRDNIIFNFQIPPALLLKNNGGIGESNVISDAFAFYNGITADDRLIMEEIFTEIFTDWEFEINKSGDFSIMPLKAYKANQAIGRDYFPYATKNQILKSIDLPEVVEEIADEKPLFESLGVGGLQSLTATLSDTNLTPEQKRSILEIVYKLTPEESKRLTA